MSIKGVLLQWFISFLIKKYSDGEIKNKIISNKELSEELQKPIIRNFEKRKDTFKDNIWGADLADMQ